MNTYSNEYNNSLFFFLKKKKKKKINIYQNILIL